MTLEGQVEKILTDGIGVYIREDENFDSNWKFTVDKLANLVREEKKAAYQKGVVATLTEIDEQPIEREQPK